MLPARLTELVLPVVAPARTDSDYREYCRATCCQAQRMAANVIELVKSSDQLPVRSRLKLQQPELQVA